MCSIGDIFRQLADVDLIESLSNSNSHPTVMVRMAAAAYGGTDSSWALVEVYPSDEMIEGRKREKA